jgi:hypothetical protein
VDLICTILLAVVLEFALGFLLGSGPIKIPLAWNL